MNHSATTYGKSTRRVAKRGTTVSKKQSRPEKPALRLSDWIIAGNSEAQHLPSWNDLSDSKSKKTKRKASRKRSKTANEQLSTARVGLIIFVSALLLGTYVSHVFATQDTLTHLEQVQRDNLRLQLEYNQKKANFDRRISPTEIYQRAQELGLQEGTSFGQSIEWSPLDE